MPSDQTVTPDGIGGQTPPASYRLYMVTRFSATLALTIMNLAVAWSLYLSSGNPIYLGLAGLVVFLPSLVLMLAVGMVLDRMNRHIILAASYLLLAACALALALLASRDALRPGLVLIILTFVGVARAFYIPAVKTLLVNLVDGSRLPQAIALNTSLAKIAVVGGPIAGGVLYSLSPSLPLFAAAGVFAFAGTTAARLTGSRQVRSVRVLGAAEMLGGLKAIRNDPALLGTITLDFFVMFISGATALLPVFAKDVLQTDAIGLGFLRAAPAAGAFAMAFWLAWHPLRRHAGSKMLAAVAGYGLTILVFGLSTSMTLSLCMLCLGGAFDMISVNIRESLVQMRTPDALRGRVTAVNSVVIGASNELGDFRAGSLAALVGAVPSVLFGGLAALGVAWAWYARFPLLRRIDRLE